MQDSGMDVVKSKHASIYDKCKEVVEQLDLEIISLKHTYDSMRTKQKVLKKHLTNLEKKIQKTQKKIKSNRKPCGFAKPTVVSNDMCNFMKRPHGSLVSRTDVTKALIQYIKENQLQNVENKRHIKPDDVLYNLFGEESRNHEITYFTMQKYVNQHFTKQQK